MNILIIRAVNWGEKLLLIVAAINHQYSADMEQFQTTGMKRTGEAESQRVSRKNKTFMAALSSSQRCFKRKCADGAT